MELTDVAESRGAIGVSLKLTMLALYHRNPLGSSPEEQQSAASGGVPQHAYGALVDKSSAPPQKDTGDMLPD